MATFANTTSPTPFGFFDTDTGFQGEADAMVTFVKRKMGDDILSVELTKKQIWACFEESFCEYGAVINKYQAQSQLMNLMGIPTGSFMSGSANIGPHGKEQMWPKENLEFVIRRAEPYAFEAGGMGGSFDTISGSITMVENQQDYNIYTDLKDGADNIIFDQQAEGSKTKLKIMEVFHFSTQAAYRFFDTTSAINYLNNEFSFESFTPETVFYVLPVFEDVLRGGMLDMSNRVRRSNYTWKISGKNIRIYPRPSGTPVVPKKLWLRVAYSPDPFSPSIQDDTMYGVSNMSNLPYGNLMYSKINSIGRQWIRQYTLASSKELLGLVRSKFGSVPIPGGDLSLNGTDLVSQGREEKTNLKTDLKEMMDTMTYDSMIESEAAQIENLQNILRHIPPPNGRCIIMG
jgi:hypothetical protein